MSVPSLAIGIFLVAVVTAYAEPVDFAREIQPVLAAHCLACHGPDEQQGGLRLDEPTIATRPAASGATPIVPGNPRESVILARMRSDDPAERMPPEGARVSGQALEQITAWIREGAEYRQHWAYRNLARPRLPREVAAPWAKNPIDQFVAARLLRKSLSPAPVADRYTLVKRLYYDLLGIPPRVDEVDAFVGSRSPNAYEQLVERLLASPRFGERWGRHWLDRARYADSDGYEKDNARPNAWHYRDWVIEAINRDLPFDEFTIDQLAGDLLPHARDDQQLATAFHRQTLTNTEGGTDREQWRVAAVMDRAETLGTVWLGLTVGCARCHNHKYDQISQDEYYQLYAFFNNGDEVSRELTTLRAGEAKVRIVSQRREEPRETHVLRRGDFLQPQHRVAASTLKALPQGATNGDADRLDLARWLVNGTNPLPPRVAVNHIWQSLFGEGLVRTVNDFGIRGDSPTHPDLLDWLASEFVAVGWSTKHLIRTIVLSHTYQQASKHRTDLAQIDPLNRLLHRQNRYRVEAEIIRDITLGSSGLLSGRIGGPSVFPPIPPSVTELTYNSGFQWKTSEGEDRYRRGLYTFFKRTAPHPNLTTFDCPSSTVTNVKRERSNTPIGALVTLNNTVYVEAARSMALVVWQVGSSMDGLRHLWRRCVARPPQASELDRLHDAWTRADDYYQRNPREAIALTGSESQATEIAPWIIASRIVLNLDEFITRE